MPGNSPSTYTLCIVIILTSLQLPADVTSSRRKVCRSHPCHHGGKCELIRKNTAYECNCRGSYGGVSCERDLGPCYSSPCLHEGSCSNNWPPCHDVGNCTNSKEKSSVTYSCKCIAGYDGPSCKHDVNECLSRPCQNGGKCTDHPRYYSCSCPNGIRGTNCEIEVRECASWPCMHRGTCIEGLAGYKCKCVEPYRGVHCRIDGTICVNSPCKNSATCSNVSGTVSCVCHYGYLGQMCEIDIDECASQPCRGNVDCYDQPNGYICDAAPYIMTASASTVEFTIPLILASVGAGIAILVVSGALIYYRKSLRSPSRQKAQVYPAERTRQN